MDASYLLKRCPSQQSVGLTDAWERPPLVKQEAFFISAAGALCGPFVTATNIREGEEVPVTQSTGNFSGLNPFTLESDLHPVLDVLPLASSATDTNQKSC